MLRPGPMRGEMPCPDISIGMGQGQVYSLSSNKGMARPGSAFKKFQNRVPFR